MQHTYSVQGILFMFELVLFDVDFNSLLLVVSGTHYRGRLLEL